MARRKRSSRVLERAQRRLDGVQSIDQKLDAGGGFTALGYQKMIAQLRADISAYNTALSTVDALTNKVAETELQLAEYSERMLLGVAAKYGKDSHEYEMAGGVKKSDRKRPARKVAAAVS
ncbi:MAG: hypothetical protein DCF25_21225 [Leptolyngbya foveolarum]|uniref:ATPase involved in DNA repair n=1 Tax=Leptolyngbya foveolarum TaxID=47253 RepID=A0A2W4TY84_9CYAN|nr:MAG: hypothetical protein DCF25_21225 [Leptolyngbya foveolarum]